MRRHRVSGRSRRRTGRSPRSSRTTRPRTRRWRPGVRRPAGLRRHRDAPLEPVAIRPTLATRPAGSGTSSGCSSCSSTSRPARGARSPRVPALLVGLLLLLPFLDRRPERRPLRRPWRWPRPSPLWCSWEPHRARPARRAAGRRRDPPVGAQAIGGAEIVLRDACTRCHREGGAASSSTRCARGAIGVDRSARHGPEPLPPGRERPGGLSLQERRAVVAWARAVRSTVPAPGARRGGSPALALLGTQCLGCHVLDGDGRGNAPNLSRAGKARHAAWLAAWIADPTAFEYDTGHAGVRRQAGQGPDRGDRPLSRSPTLAVPRARAEVGGFRATAVGANRSRIIQLWALQPRKAARSAWPASSSR